MNTHYSADIKMYLSVGLIPVHGILENRVRTFAFDAVLCMCIDGEYSYRHVKIVPTNFEVEYK